MLEISLHRDGKLLLRRPAGNTSITIGRAPDNSISLSDPEISRHHCKIDPLNNALLIKDTSKNGTAINGRFVKEAKVKPGDNLAIGPWTLSVEEVNESGSHETVISGRTGAKLGQSRLPSRNSKLGTLIGPSRTMREVFALMERVGPTDATVCITGESGTGKELVAHELHHLSPRKRHPFVALNCGAVPESIVESQLFGHERGAFTGAVERMPGLFEQAKGGTIFLDEIGEMPLDLQTRLLRVIESKTLRRVGGHDEITVDARILCATNRDLKRMVTEGRFREDLFFRIFVVPIKIAPLRERPEDIPALVDHFISQFPGIGRQRCLTADALDALKGQAWPGNIRELKNTIERTLIFAENDRIAAKDLKFETIAKSKAIDGDWQSRERDILTSAIAECGNNLSKAAKKLGISRTTIQTKVKLYGLKHKS